MRTLRRLVRTARGRQLSTVLPARARADVFLIGDLERRHAGVDDLMDGLLPQLQFFFGECSKIAEIPQLRLLISDVLRPVFAHEIALCGIAEIEPYRVIRLINVDFPAGYLRKVIRPDQTIVSPAFRSWLCRQQPSLIRLDGVFPSQNGEICRTAAREHDILNVASHGVVDTSASTFSFFVFGNLGETAIASYSRVLGAVVPHLHAALARILTHHYTRDLQDVPRVNLPGSVGNPPAALDGNVRTTARERQILQWISMGRSNREIAKLLGISEFTVKTHVQNLLGKLAVTSRAEAVRKAMSARLFEAE